jgi:hypothetical protein
MDENSDLREYSPGDRIQIHLVIEHSFDFHDIRARFKHESEDLHDLEQRGRDPERHTIELTGSPDQRYRITMNPATGQKSSSFLLSGDLPAGKAFGEYRCIQIATLAPGGSLMPLEFAETAEIRFRLVPEPVQSPRVVEWEFRS